MSVIPNSLDVDSFTYKMQYDNSIYNDNVTFCDFENIIFFITFMNFQTFLHPWNKCIPPDAIKISLLLLLGQITFWTLRLPAVAISMNKRDLE